MMMDNCSSSSINSVASSAVSPSPSLSSSAPSSVQTMSIGGAGPSSSHASPMMMMYMMNAGGSGVGAVSAQTAAASGYGGTVQQHYQTAPEGEQPEQCLVCNDVATGYHYGTPSCNGCKTFFRRTVMKNQTFQCQYDGDCPVDKTVRCACRHCRFKKCLAVGMNKDAIQQNRDPIGYTKRTRRYASEKQQRQQKQQELNCFNSMPSSSGSGNSAAASAMWSASMMPSSSSFSSPGSVAQLLMPPRTSGCNNNNSNTFGDAFTPYAGAGFGPASVAAPVPATPFAQSSAQFPAKLPAPQPLVMNRFGGTIGAASAGASGFYNYVQQQYFQQQEQQNQQRQLAVANGTNGQLFGTNRNSGNANFAGFIFGGGPLSNRSAQNGTTDFVAAAADGCVQQQQQQLGKPQQQNGISREQMEEDKLMRRLIGIEQILIRIRNSKVNLKKSLNDLVLSDSSVFDDAATITKMSAETFPLPTVLHRAKSEDYLYWHEREWILMIEWAKMLPVYLSLSVADKLALLRNSAITFPSLIQCFYSPDVGPDTIVFPNGAFFDRTLDTESLSGFQRKNFKMLDNLLNPIRKMQIDQNEFAGAKAIFFLNPGNFEDDSDADDLTPEAKQHINVTRTAITNALYRYMVQKHGMEHAAVKFGKLLLLGTAIATMSCEMKEAVVVANFFDQVSFSSVARQLLFTRDEKGLLKPFGKSVDNDEEEDEEDEVVVVQPQQKMEDDIAKMGGTTMVPKRTDSTAAMVPMPSNSMANYSNAYYGTQQRHHGHDATTFMGDVNNANIAKTPIIKNDDDGMNSYNNNAYGIQQRYHGHDATTFTGDVKNGTIATTPISKNNNGTNNYNYYLNGGHSGKQQLNMMGMGMHGDGTVGDDTATSCVPSSTVAESATSPTTMNHNIAQSARQQQVSFSSGAAATTGVTALSTMATTTTTTAAMDKPTTALNSAETTMFNPFQTHLSPPALQQLEEMTPITTQLDQHHFTFVPSTATAPWAQQFEQFQQQQQQQLIINPPSNGSISQQSSTSPPSLTSQFDRSW